MEYIVSNKNGEILAEDIAEEKVEEMLNLKSRSSDVIFIIATKLPVSFNAKVLRSFGNQDSIAIESCGKSLHLLRDTYDQIGDLGVSCSPEGEISMVDTFNIKFRDYYDDFTDRGIVWVYPGDPASAQIIIMRRVLEMPGKVQEIIQEMNSALAEKLLDRIDLALL